MAKFFGIDPEGIINSMRSAYNAMVPGDPEGGAFMPSGAAVGGFHPAVVQGGGFAPAQGAGGGFQPSGGAGGGFQPSGWQGGGFQPAGVVGGGLGPANWQAGGFRPSEANPLIVKPITVAGGTGSGAAGQGVKSAQWASLINQQATRYADAPDLAEVTQAVIELESGGDPNAQGVVVTRGAYAGQRAQGLGQIMPGNYPGVNLLDPATNVRLMQDMLYQRFKQYGNWDSAVASYFGAVDSQGRPTTQADDNGTTGIQYVATVNGHRQAIRANAAGGKAPTGSKGMMAVTGGQPYQIMQEFGPTEYSNAHQSTYQYASAYGASGHTGLDMATPRGTRTYTPVGGTVINAGGTGVFTDSSQEDGPGRGELKIELDNGDQIILGHMSQINLRPGQRINAGDLVGLSGGSDGDHIHLEVRRVDKTLPSGYRIVDPSSYFGG